MAYRVYGDQIYTSDMADKSCNQKVMLNSNCLLLALRIGLIFYNGPVFTNLRANIYSSRDSLPNALLHASENSFSSADILTEANGVKEVYFHFKVPDGVKLAASEVYFIVLSASGYTGNANVHIAWAKQWPKLSYRTNQEITYENLLDNPRQLALIGAKL